MTLNTQRSTLNTQHSKYSLSYRLKILCFCLLAFSTISHANTQSCTNDQNGTIDPIINLYGGCIITSDQQIHPNSIGQADVRLLSLDLDELSSVTAQDVHNAMTKLIIYVGGLADNGIHISQDVTISEAKRRAILISDLDVFLQNGYSVLYVGLDNTKVQPDVTVEDTAYALEGVLSYINGRRDTDYGKVALLGHSMGAISARIALAGMELNNYDHNVGIYVSYDAPHRGANVPQGLQYIIPTMEQYLLDVQTALNNATSDMASMGITVSLSILGDTVQNHLAKIKNNLDYIVVNSMLAKQMLMQNVSGETAFNALQAELITLGYPQKTLNVAITNGSVQGVGLPTPEVNSNGAIYEFYGKKGVDVSKAYLGAHFSLFPTEAGETNLTADFNWWFQKVHYVFGVPVTQTITGGVPKSHSTNMNFVSYDQVPGSKGNLIGLQVNANNMALGVIDVTPGDMLNDATDILRPEFNSPAAIDDVYSSYTFTFVPTFSALDMQVADINQSLDTSESPFDIVYVNGDKSINNVEDNVSHLRVKWPLALQGQIDQATKPIPTAEEQAVIWLNHFSGNYAEMEGAVRYAFDVVEGTRLSRSLQALVFDMADYNQFDAGPYTTVYDVEELFGAPTPFKDQPNNINALITYIKTQNILYGYTNAQCVTDQNPQVICEKIVD